MNYDELLKKALIFLTALLFSLIIALVGVKIIVNTVNEMFPSLILETSANFYSLYSKMI